MAKKAASADEHEHIDGCLCDVGLGEAELTSDADLPAAKGGIQKSLRKSSIRTRQDDAIDGCDLDFNAGVLTGDEELPAAKGGTI